MLPQTKSLFDEYIQTHIRLKESIKSVNHGPQTMAVMPIKDLMTLIDTQMKALEAIRDHSTLEMNEYIIIEKQFHNDKERSN